MVELGELHPLHYLLFSAPLSSLTVPLSWLLSGSPAIPILADLAFASLCSSHLIFWPAMFPFSSHVRVSRGLVLGPYLCSLCRLSLDVSAQTEFCLAPRCR